MASPGGFWSYPHSHTNGEVAPIAVIRSKMHAVAASDHIAGSTEIEKRRIYRYDDHSELGRSIMDSLDFARACIDLGPNNYVCCASALLRLASNTRAAIV